MKLLDITFWLHMYMHIFVNTNTHKFGLHICTQSMYTRIHTNKNTNSHTHIYENTSLDSGLFNLWQTWENKFKLRFVQSLTQQTHVVIWNVHTKERQNQVTKNKNCKENSWCQKWVYSFVAECIHNYLQLYAVILSPYNLMINIVLGSVY